AALAAVLVRRASRLAELGHHRHRLLLLITARVFGATDLVHLSHGQALVFHLLAPIGGVGNVAHERAGQVLLDVDRGAAAARDVHLALVVQAVALDLPVRRIVEAELVLFGGKSLPGGDGVMGRSAARKLDEGPDGQTQREHAKACEEGELGPARRRALLLPFLLGADAPVIVVLVVSLGSPIAHGISSWCRRAMVEAAKRAGRSELNASRSHYLTGSQYIATEKKCNSHALCYDGCENAWSSLPCQ